MVKVISFFFNSIWKRFLLILIVTFVMGEVYFQLPGVLPLLRYSPDSKLGHQFEPNQLASIWLGNFSIVSPPISINNFGLRGRNIDWSKDSILVLGSSEVFGSGVADSETWAYLLEKEFLKNGTDIQVINGGCTGYGPYHALQNFRRIVDKVDLNTVIVRVSAGDRLFKLPSTGGMNRPSENSLLLTIKDFTRNNSQFLRFMVNKSQAQVSSIKNAIYPFFINSVHQKKKTSSRQIKFFEDNLIYLESMVSIALEKKVSLVFLVIDPGEYQDGIVFNSLSNEFSQTKNVSILYLGADSFNMGCVPEKELRRTVRSKFTFGFDPHANQLQHKIISQNLYNYLDGKI